MAASSDNNPILLSVVAQPMAQLAARVENQRRDLRRDALLADSIRRTRHRKRADHRAGVVANRHRDRRYLIEILARIDRVAVARNRLELREELRAIGYGAFGE